MLLSGGIEVSGKVLGFWPDSSVASVLDPIAPSKIESLIVTSTILCAGLVAVISACTTVFPLAWTDLVTFTVICTVLVVGKSGLHV